MVKKGPKKKKKGLLGSDLNILTVKALKKWAIKGISAKLKKGGVNKPFDHTSYILFQSCSCFIEPAVKHT